MPPAESRFRMPTARCAAAGFTLVELLVVLTLIVLAEKTLPYGRAFSRGLGLALIAWGVWLIASA